MTHRVGGLGGARAAYAPRLALLALPTLLLAGLTLLDGAAYAATLDVTSINATVGRQLSEDVTFSQSSGAALELHVVVPADTAGVTTDVTSVEAPWTVHVGGTPTHAADLKFRIVGTNETGTETATLTVTVLCPELIKVDASTAAACLPTIVEGSVGVEGALVTDTFTSITPASGDPHTAYTGQPDGCASCHRTHSDRNQTFIVNNTQSHAEECLTCHDGTGAYDPTGTRANTHVAATYATASGSGRVNNPDSRSYYSHDALATNSGHIAATADENGDPAPANEFQGTLNRHSDCVDCHNPHAASVTPAASQQSVAGAAVGWSLSGAVQSASLANMSVDSASAFVGRGSTATNFEYQLCLKCHSSFTQLPTNDTSTSAPLRSTDWLDKSAEIDPQSTGNASFHPIMSRGTNQSSVMTASLTGTSAYKVWRFTVNDTVRCTNCHASSAAAGGPGQPLSPHVSLNRGILLRPYKDRVLKSSSEAFDEHEFALCFVCHTDVPFTSAYTTTGTAFRYHAVHVETVTVGTGETNTSTSIDTPFAGQGHALCSECHFRLHSTKFKVSENGQQVDGSRLVNFAPNVQPAQVNGQPVLSWTRAENGQHGTCTLICHGAVHKGTAY